MGWRREAVSGTCWQRTCVHTPRTQPRWLEHLALWLCTGQVHWGFAAWPLWAWGRWADRLQSRNGLSIDAAFR
jgi:hypothetical protein